MVMVSSTTGYTASDAREAQLFGRSKWFKGDATVPGVIFHHGASSPYGTASKAIDRTNQAAMCAILYRIADEGFPWISCDFGYQQDLYANDTNLSRITDAKTTIQTARGADGLYGAKTGKVALIGQSMGGGAAMAWARANPTLVSCLILVIPMSDLNDIVVNNRGGVAAAVNTAYGTYNDATHGPTHSPVQFASQLAGIPTQIWYATDDTTVIPSTVTTVISGIGASCEAHTLTGDHTNAAVAQIDVEQVITFLKAHA